MSREVPAEWAKLIEAAGFVKERRPHGPSMKQLAEASGVHQSTLSALIFGDRESDPATVDKVVAALAERIKGKSPERLRLEVFALARKSLAEADPFQLHPDADLLTAQERNAVNELIRLLALPKKQGGEADGDAAPTKLRVDHAHSLKRLNVDFDPEIYNDKAAYPGDQPVDQPTTE